MVVLAVYLDESKPDDGRLGVFAVGGIVLDASGMELFEERWGNVLTSRSLKVGHDEFHATDFDARRGAFRAWSRDEQSVAFQSDLIDIVKETALFGFTTVLDLGAAEKYARAWSAILPDEAQGLTGRLSGTYLLGTLGCLGTIGQYLRLIGHSEPAVYVLDSISDPHKGKGDIRRAVEIVTSTSLMRDGFMIGDVAWSDSREKLPLQGADLFVYEMAKELARVHGYTSRAQRRSAKRLLEVPDGKWGFRFLNEQLLAEMWRDNVNRFLARIGAGVSI
jgi:hypothetical protein